MSEVRAEFPVGGGVSVSIYFPGHLAPGEWDTMLRVLEAMKPAIVAEEKLGEARPKRMLPDNPPDAMCECGDEASKHQRRSEWCLKCGNCSRFKLADGASLKVVERQRSEDGGTANWVTTDLRGQNHPCTCGHWRTSHEDSRGPCDSCDGCLRYKAVKSDA